MIPDVSVQRLMSRCEKHPASTGGEHGNVRKIHSCCFHHSFRIGHHFLYALRAFAPQLWRLSVMDEDDVDQTDNWTLIIGFVILMGLVLWAAHTHGQL